LEKFGIVRSILHGVDLVGIISSKGSERIKQITLALEDLEDLAAVAERRNEESVSLEEVEAQLKCDGLLPD
jgi:hypothetical protein